MLGGGGGGQSPVLEVRSAPIYSRFHSQAFPNQPLPGCDRSVWEVSDHDRRETTKIDKRPGTPIWHTKVWGHNTKSDIL